MKRERIEELLALYRNGLFEDVLPFWLRHSVDRRFEGFMTSLNRDGSVVDTDKAMWQQGRFTWLLGELYNNAAGIDPKSAEDRDRWLEAAKLGINFMDRFGYDSADGRMWFHVTREGRPIRKRRYAFTESFAAIGYAEYAQATGKEQYAEKAVRALKTFIDYCTVPRPSLAKFTDVRPMQSIGFPLIMIGASQELRDSIDWPEADYWIDRSVETIERYFLKEDLRAVMENVGPKGEIYDHFDGRILNPGHAIEAAWFIMREGEIRGDQRLVSLGTKMLDWSLERGWDEEYGGLLYFVDLKGLPVQEYWHDMKFWWPHAEALIATLLAWHLTGEEKYALMHEKIHTWTYSRFPDPEYGEWFGYLHRDGGLSSPLKGNFWKGPFHIPRMQLVCTRILKSKLEHAEE